MNYNDVLIFLPNIFTSCTTIMLYYCKKFVVLLYYRSVIVQLSPSLLFPSSIHRQNGFHPITSVLVNDPSKFLIQWSLVQNKDCDCILPHMFPNKRPQCAKKRLICFYRAFVVNLFLMWVFNEFLRKISFIKMHGISL